MKARLLLVLALGMAWAVAAAAQQPPYQTQSYPPAQGYAPQQVVAAQPAYAPTPAAQTGALPPPNWTPSTGAPTAAAPQAAAPAPVIHYYVVAAPAAPAGCASCAPRAPERACLLRDPFRACVNCGREGSCSEGGAGACSGREGHDKSWCRDPFGAFKSRCDEFKQRCDERSCDYGKTLNDFGCRGCRLDCVFIFGDCHEFFQEPCRRIR